MIGVVLADSEQLASFFYPGVSATLFLCVYLLQSVYVVGRKSVCVVGRKSICVVDKSLYV